MTDQQYKDTIKRRKDRLDHFCVIFGIANDLNPNLVRDYAKFLQGKTNRAWATLHWDWRGRQFRDAVEQNALDETPEQVHAKLVSQMRQKLFLK
jgi:hypothetical protein